MARPIGDGERLRSSTEPLERLPDFKRLVAFVTGDGPRFGLALARCATTEVRERVLAGAVRQAHAARRYVRTLDLADAAPDSDLVARLGAAVAPPRGRRADAVFVNRLEPLLLDRLGTRYVSPAVAGLNQRRDALPEAAPARIVFWLSHEGADALAAAARDLYDVLLTFFRFEATLGRAGAVPESPAFALAPQDPKPQGSRGTSAVMEPPDRYGREAPRAFGLRALARMHAERRQDEQALQLYREALGELEAMGNRRERAVTLGELARIYERLGDYAAALPLLKEQIAVYERLRLPRQRALALGEAARIHQQQGRLEDARSLYEQEIRAYERPEDRLAKAEVLADLAMLRWRQGDLDHAQRLYEEALQEAAPGRTCKALDSARGAWAGGRLVAAMDHYEQAFRELLPVEQAAGGEEHEPPARRHRPPIDDDA